MLLQSNTSARDHYGVPSVRRVDAPKSRLPAHVACQVTADEDANANFSTVGRREVRVSVFLDLDPVLNQKGLKPNLSSRQTNPWLKNYSALHRAGPDLGPDLWHVDILELLALLFAHDMQRTDGDTTWFLAAGQTEFEGSMPSRKFQDDVEHARCFGSVRDETLRFATRCLNASPQFRRALEHLGDHRPLDPVWLCRPCDRRLYEARQVLLVRGESVVACRARMHHGQLFREWGVEENLGGHVVTSIRPAPAVKASNEQPIVRERADLVHVKEDRVSSS